MNTRLRAAWAAILAIIRTRRRLSQDAAEYRSKCTAMRKQVRDHRSQIAHLQGELDAVRHELEAKEQANRLLSGRVEVLERQLEEFAALHQANRELFDCYAATFAASRARVDMLFQSGE